MKWISWSMCFDKLKRLRRQTGKNKNKEHDEILRLIHAALNCVDTETSDEEEP